MEEEKKKFLLSRIKRQQQTIQNDYNKFNRLFISKSIRQQNFIPYIEHAKHLMNNNNTFAMNLHEYLQKQQIQNIFQRANSIFEDLLAKFKTKHTDYVNLQNSNDARQIRQICQICSQKIQKNKIINIQQHLSYTNECKASMLKKLIQQSERQQKKPLFTYEQDKIFKQNLDKIFEDKERLLFMKFRQSDNFIQIVEKQITNFMVDFRRQLALYQKNNLNQKETQNWTSMMKIFISKKLANSFEGKMPSFIKKMHNIFLNNLSTIKKPLTIQKTTQTAQIKSDKQSKEQQIKDLKQKLKLKTMTINKYQDEMMKLKIANQLLNKEVQKLTVQCQTKIAVVTYKSKKIIQHIQQKYTNHKIQIEQQRHRHQQQRQRQATLLSQRIQKEQQYQNNKQTQQFLMRKKKKKLRTIKIATEKQQQINKFNKQQQLNDSINKTQQFIDYAKQQLKNMNSHDDKKQKLVNQDKKQIKNDKQIINKNKQQKKSKLIVITNKSNSKLQQKNVSKANLKKKYKRQETSIKSIQQKQQIENKLKDVCNDVQIKKHSQISNIKSVLKNQVKQVSRRLSKDMQKFKNDNNSNNNKSSIHHQSQSSYKGALKYQSSIIYAQSVVNTNTQQNQILITKIQNSDAQKQKHGKQLQRNKKISQFNQTLQKLLKMDIINEGPQANLKSKLLQLIQQYLKASQNVKNSLQKQCSLPKIKVSTNNLQQNSILDDLKNKQSKILNKKGSKVHKSMYNNSQKISKIDKNQNQHKNSCLIKIPCINQLENSRLKTSQNENSIFNSDIVGLFMTNQIAQQYENDHNTKHLMKPTPSEFQYIQYLYSIFEGLNKNHLEIYHQMCSFIKQPSTALRNKNYKIYDHNENIQFSSFCNHFMRIMWLHSNCKHKQGKKFCSHIQKFAQKLNLMMISQPIKKQQPVKVHKQNSVDKENNSPYKQNNKKN